MGRIPYSKDLHELLEGYCVVELEGLAANICEVLLRNEISNATEHGLEFLLAHSAALGMEIEYLEEGLSLCCLEGILMLLLHSNVNYNLSNREILQCSNQAHLPILFKLFLPVFQNKILENNFQLPNLANFI
jgi:hypothetical protein